MNRWLYSYVGTVLVILCITTAQNCWDLKPADWAAWVQALGSIGAIIGAVAVSMHQMREQRQNTAAERRQTAALEMDSYLRVVQYAVDQVTNVSAQITDTGHEVLRYIWPYYGRQMEAAFNALSAYPIAKLPGTNAIFQHNMLIVFIRDLMNEAQEYATANPEEAATLMERIRSQARGYSESVSNIQTLLVGAINIQRDAEGHD